MPETKFQRLIFALITVIITVPCFVFYCSSYEAGGFTIDIIKNSIIFIPIEFILAYLCEIFIGSPLSVKLALKAMPPQKNSPMMVETAIICATVGIMCPLMSFLATILYNGIIAVGIYHQISFSYFMINFIPFWLQKVVLNFPFALLSQLFFIQPLTRTIFKNIFSKKSKEYFIENEEELIETTETIPSDITQ